MGFEREQLSYIVCVRACARVFIHACIYMHAHAYIHIYVYTLCMFSDCQGIALPQLVAMASSRSLWRAKVASLS